MSEHDATRTMLRDLAVQRAIAQQWGLLSSDVSITTERIYLRSKAAIGLMRRYGLHAEANSLEQSPSSLVDLQQLQHQIFARQMGLDAIVLCRPIRPRLPRLVRIGRAIGIFIGTLCRKCEVGNA